MNFFTLISEIIDRKAVKQADLWAARYFPEQQHVAAITARIVAAEAGVRVSTLTPETRFIEDLRLVELEPVELHMALEEEFKFEISDDVLAGTLRALICYLHDRVHKSEA